MTQASSDKPAIRPPCIGVALGSGGARGWAHVGVLQRLQEMGVPVACVAGSSIGAVMGAAFAAGRIDVVEDLAREMDWRRVAALFFEVSFPRAGLVSGKRIQQLLQDIVGVDRIEDLPLPFAAVAADLHTEAQVILASGGLVDAIRASIAIPGIFVPVRHAAHDLIDGGMINPLPIDVARLLGAESVIAVDVNLRAGLGCPLAIQDARTGRSPASRDLAAILAHVGEHLPPLHGAMADAMQRWLHREPRELNIFEVLTRSVRIAENQITRSCLKTDPPTILIQPAVGSIDTLDFHHAAPAIAAGRAATDAVADQIRALL